MATRLRAFCISGVTLIVLAASAYAKDMAMKGSELTALLSGGKTINLGGPGESYSGTLTLAADGTGNGSGKENSGAAFTITGTWKIKGDKFCRQWNINGNKEICETWVMVGPNKVNVMDGKKKIGVNWW